MDLTDLLQNHLSEQMIDQLSQQLGGEDKKKTAVAANGAVATIMAALAKNASNPQGASSLASALERDHDGSILNDVMGMITGRQPQAETVQSRMLDGSGILKHVLGGKQGSAVDMISKMSGLSSDKSGSLLTMLAPVIMGMLGKTKQQENLDAGGISDLLNGFVNSQEQGGNPTMGMIGRFLDQDGDGSVIDDIAGFGMKMLGGFFKRGK
jgi:hypothetical protein